MSKPWRYILLLLALLYLLTGSGRAAPPTDWQHKVDPALLADAQQDFLVVLRPQADLSAARALPDRLAKTRYVVHALQAVAAHSQPPLLAELRRQGADFRPFWVVNMVWVRANPALLPRLAQRPDVAYLVADVHVRAPEAVAAAFPAARPAAPPWNITLIHAEQLWARGITGQGVTIGGQDTGYQWNHPALKAAYRGWDGSTAHHDYNWHDAIHSNQHGYNVCGANAPAPCDDHNHGTHTMGIMVGDDGQGTPFGVAPGARWIGCRNMDNGVGSPSTYSECFQWFLAPTDGQDQNPRPDLAPAIINNSWSCPASEGCGAAQTQMLETVVQDVRAAGILVVVSAGNGGPSCGTVDEPPARYAAAFAVAAVDSTGKVADFSSRGPTPDGLLKPDVAAPGAAVWSSLRNNNYGLMSGTSMAAPHVAGLAALLIAANPALDGQVERLEAILRQSAAPQTAPQTCGVFDGAQSPNAVYGYGLVDALAAFQMAARPQYLPLIVAP